MPAIGVRPWTPKSIAAVAWYDATDPGTITESSGVVSQWDDKSGNANHLAQATSTNRPKTNTRTINGLNALEFITDDFLLASAFPIPASGDVAIFMVTEIDAIDNGFDAMFGLSATAGMQFDSGSSTQFDANIRAGNIGNNLLASGGPFPGPSIYNCNFDYNGIGAYNIFVDALKVSTDEAYTQQLDSPSDLTIMANRGQTQFIDGTVAEVIIVEDVTQKTRQEIEGYLAHKWGLTANLPGNHPFKYNPPTDTSLTADEVDWTPAGEEAVGWYDASDASTITESGGEVSQWADKSGNGRHLTNTENFPEWGLGAQINGKNVIHYKSTFDELFIDGLPDIDLTQFAMITVLEPKAGGDYPAGGALIKTDETDKAEFRFQGVDGSGHRGTSPFTLDGNLSSVVTAYDEEITDDTPFIGSYWYDGADVVCRTNGGKESATVDVADGATFTVNRIQVGRESNTPKNYQAELIILPVADLDSIQRAEGYLAHKWGLNNNLPVSHPYKDTPPKRAPKLWTPEQVPTATAWFDAADLDTITESSGSVSQLDDKSGNANHVSNATGAEQPKTGTRNLNGLNVLDFDGADDNLEHGTSLNFPNGVTIVAVFDQDATELFDRAFGVRDTTGGEKETFAFASDNSLRYDGAHELGSIPAATGPHLRVATKSADGLSQIDYIDGSLNINGSQTLPDSAGAFINIGDPTRDGTSSPFEGGIGECIMIDGAVSDATRQKIEGYLAWKWGMNHKLPNTHPYFQRPPLV